MSPAAPGESTCRFCGAAILRPRKGQTCCSVECRRGFDRMQRQRRRQQPARHRATCPWCEQPFESQDPRRRFCSPEHKHAFHDHWKGRGPALAIAMIDWRSKKRAGAITRVCRAFAEGRAEQKTKAKMPKRGRA